MHSTQIHLPSLIQALHAVHRVPYIQGDGVTSTTIGLAAMGAYGRSILVEETFWSHGMSDGGVQAKTGTALVRLSHLVDRIVASQLAHANTYRGQA